jgi:hypothetical protein
MYGEAQVHPGPPLRDLHAAVSWDWQLNLSLKKLTPINRRLAIALGCYAGLALIGAVALDGILRGAVLCFLAILAVKTVIHAKKDEETP